MDSSVIFARLRQCAPPTNTCFLGPTWVHTLNDISIGSAVLAHLTAEDIYTLQQAAPFPSKLPLLMGDLDSCLTNAYLGPFHSVRPHSSLQSVPIVQNGPLIPPQNCPFTWGTCTPSNTRFLGDTRVHNPNGILISSAVLQGSWSWETHWQSTLYQ